MGEIAPSATGRWLTKSRETCHYRRGVRWPHNGAMLKARRLASNARPFRYFGYPIIGLGFLMLDAPAPWQAAAALLWCLLWPLGADLLQRGILAQPADPAAAGMQPEGKADLQGGGDTARASIILRIHLAEMTLALGLFAWLGCNTNLLYGLATIMVASNALQGGMVHAVVAILAGALGVVAGGALSPASSAFAVSLAFAYSGALVLIYCALLGHMAHRQALAISTGRAEARTLNNRLRQYLPHTLAERLLQAPEPSLERRWLVVAFADLAGFTPLVERLQTEELAAVLDSYLQTIAKVTKNCGGTLSKGMGDGAMLVFGEAGDDARAKLVANALLCCRTLHEELAQQAAAWRSQGMPAPVRLKVGMASGYCSLGDWGGGGRLEYTVMGHPVNLASRLEGLAEADEVLICERTGLLARAQLSGVLEQPVKGLGPVRFQKVQAY